MTYKIPPDDLDVIQSLIDQERLEDLEEYISTLRKLLDMRKEADPHYSPWTDPDGPLRFRAPRGGIKFWGDNAAPVAGATFTGEHPTPDSIVLDDGSGSLP